MPIVVAWLAGFGVLAVPESGSAELITVAADDGASFKAGDSFAYSFTFNDATTDTAIQTFNAQFNAGVSAFSLTRGVSNTGTWDPAHGTFAVSPIANMSVNATVPEPATVASLGGAALLWVMTGCRRTAWRGRRPAGRSRAPLA